MPKEKLMEPQELVRKTLEEIGVKSLRALGRTVFVRTEKPPEKIGLIWLPPKQASFYGEMMHKRLVIATVLASGAKCSVKAGDRVCFVRQFFARWQGLGDEQFVGWLEEGQIAGYAETLEERVIPDVRQADPEGDAPACRHHEQQHRAE